MKIRVNDKVKVIKGKDRGKSGKVIQVFPKQGLAVVEGLNLRYKHLRARKRGESGERIEFSAPIAISNLKLICPKCSQPTRVSFKILEDAKPADDLAKTKAKPQKVRICKKCQEVIS